MFEIKCFDSNGNSVNHLTQWDLNQTLYIENWEYELSPVFHFCNKKTDKALVVTGEVLEDGSAKVSVPNILLEEACPIIVYVFLYNEDDVSGKTLYTIKLPVEARKKPSDYEYEDNAEKITISYLDARITNMIRALSDDTSATELSVEIQDMRVGYDGTIHSTAGEALRQQVAIIPNQAALTGNKIQFYRCVNDASAFLFDLDVTELLESGLSLENLQLSIERTSNAIVLYMSDGENVKSIELPMVVDSVLSVSSTNPVQNRVVTEQINYVIEEIENIKQNGIGGGEGVVVRLTNQNGTATLVGSYGNAVSLMFTFTSTDNDLPTGNANCKITVNGIQKVNMSIPQGLTSIDIAPYLNIGSNTVIVTCTDIYGKSRSLAYDVTIVQLSIESTFNASVPYSSDILFKYKPYGSVEKKIHFVIDGTEIGTVITSLSGKDMSRTIPKMSHGSHKLEVYSTATLNDTDLTSPKLVYDIICVEDGDTTPIIASVYEEEVINQGEQVSIPFIIYDPTRLSCDISHTIYTMESGSKVIYSEHDVTVDRSQQYWNTRKYPIGEVYFEIKYGDIIKTHKVEVLESKLKIEAEKNDLELHLSSEGRSNNETNPNQWTYGDITTTFENMNWNSVGWINDENGDACLRLNGDSTAEIQFMPFSEDLRVYGKTIELDFVIRDVNNRNAIPISCMSNGLGFEVKPDTAYLKSEQSRVFCNYKEEERVRVSFVIQSTAEYRMLLIYLNGVLSDAVQYPTSDNFQQLNPVTIKIGSPYCGIDIYNIRSYSTALSDTTIVTNYIADITDVVKKTEVWENNDIYDEFGNISYSKAKEKNSIMIIVGDLPTYKGDKKDCKIYYYDVEDSNLDYIDTIVVIDVQGTSSQWYVRKNWKLKMSENHYIDINQLPAKVMCIKVDYAEATGTHNTQNANFVERLYTESVPPQSDEPKVRTTIYGKPILLFHQEAEGVDPVFYGKANYNYDKGAEHVFGFTSNYDVECWEFCNNTSDACNFKGVIPSSWGDDFEARYPDGYKNISRFKVMHDWVVSTRQDTATGNALSSTYIDVDGNEYTHDTAEYRLAKFKTEFENYFNMHYALVYYVYTFFALMVDQRAKNMFLTYWGNTGKWYFYFYDNDTSFGINNEGNLEYDYYHEDIDVLGNANVYNGQESTLWVNFRQAFPDLIQETYQDLRSNSVLNYEELIDQFITNGSDKWSESIYNEDGDFKYISMLREKNDASNLPQVRGTGEEHFRYFIENRLNYCDSKWYAGEYPDDYVNIRIYTPIEWGGVEPNASITVTPYSAMYAGVRYKANGTLYQERLDANETYTFEAPNETFNNTETAIYGASQLSSLGDLAPLYCGYIDVSNATKLTELKVGDNTEGYFNDKLYKLTLGTNRLLKKVDVRNCIALKDAIGLTGCPNIEEIYATGSAITGIDLPNSGYLKIVELPNTIANLTLKNQLYIEKLTLEGYDSIKTIQIENCPSVNSLDILDKAVNVERVRLTNVDWHYDNASILYDFIERDIAGIDENGVNTDTMWIDGKCHIKSLTGDELAEIKSLYPYLTITYENLTSQLIYMSDDGMIELHRETINNGGNGNDPVTNGTISTPTKESTAQYHFTYNGWSLTIGGDADSNALLKVETDRYVYAAYKKELRSYTVKFYNGTILLQSVIVKYGSDATYTGSTPVKQGYTTAEFEFVGWKPEPTNIQGDTDCYAQYFDLREIEDNWGTIATNCYNPENAKSKYEIGAFKPVIIGGNKLPYSFYQGCSVTFNDEIHILGGAESKTSHYKWNGSEWVQVSTLPYDFYLGSAVVYNNEIHILGGDRSYKKHYKWNDSEWIEVGTLPYNFYVGQAVVYNNDIHLLGGYTTSHNEHYKWNGSEWVQVSTLPYGFFYGTSAVYNNEIYILGGTNHVRNFYKYNGTEWVKINTTSYNFQKNKIFVYNNELHVIGSGDLNYRNKHYKWNGSEWVQMKNCPFGFFNGCVTLYNNQIHVLGSEDALVQKNHYYFDGTEWNVFGEHEIIDMEVVAHEHDELADEYKWVNLFTTSSIGTAGFYYNNRIYITNSNGYISYFDIEKLSMVSLGQFSSTYKYTYQIYLYNNMLNVFGCDGAASKAHHFVYNEETNTWTDLGETPFYPYYAIAVTYNNAIYVLGDYNTSKTCYKYDGTTWTECGKIPINTQKSCACVHNGILHLIGQSKYYTFDGTTWTEIATMSFDARTSSVVVYNNELHLYGDNNDKKIHRKWNGEEWEQCYDKLPFDKNSIISSDNNEMYLFDSNNVYKYVPSKFENLQDSSYGFQNRGGYFNINNELYILHSNTLYKREDDDWTIVSSSLPFSGHINACLFNGEIYAYQQTTDQSSTYFKKLYKYDWDTMTWIEVCTFPNNGGNLGSTIIEYNGCLHVLGGNYVYSGATHYKWDGSSWTQDIDLLNDIGYCGATVYNDELHVFSGAYHWKFNGTEWTTVSTPPWNGLNLALNSNSYLAVLNNKIHVTLNGSVFRWDGSKWETLQSISHQAMFICPYRGHVYLFGSGTSAYSKKQYVYKNPRATLTFLARNLLKDGRKYHSTTDAYWSISDLRMFCNGDLYNDLSDILQTSISEVIKMSDTGANGQSIEVVNDKIWICSVEELGGDISKVIKGQGDAYPIFTDNNSRVRTNNDGVKYNYWTRSVQSNWSSYAMTIGSQGQTIGVNQAQELYEDKPKVLFGFCI